MHFRHDTIRHLFGAISTMLIVFGCSCNGCNDRVLPEQTPEDAAARYADRLCEAEAACGCGRYASIEECKSDIIAAFEVATEEISDFDEPCFDRVLETIKARGCDSVSEVMLDCTAITGAAPIGAECERDPRLQTIMPGGTCKSDAVCDLGTGLCQPPSEQPPIPVKQVDDACVPHHIQSCGYDLYCAPNASCQVRTADGEACAWPRECELGSFCSSESGLCTPDLQPGEACDPNDWSNCANAWTSETTLESSWCNPNTSQCEVGELYVCSMLDYPFVP